MKCKNCGEELEKDSNFCEKCGAKVLNEDNSKEIDVADLGPDELDELMPKNKHTLLIFFLCVIVLGAIAAFVYFDLTDKKEEKEQKENDNQTIINDYGKAIEKVAGEYLLDHELINDFSEIKDKVEYGKHKVVCDNVIINIDGTVYLSKCSIDGVKVDEVYGRKKNILAKDDACNILYQQEDQSLEFYVDKELISVYECEHDKCGLYEPTNYNSCLDMLAIIEDGDTKYFYNYQVGQNVIDPLAEIAVVKNEKNILGFIVKDLETEKWGYVDKRGTEKIKMDYETLGLVSDGKLYERGISLKDNKIIASKNNKYGVLNLSTGEKIIDFKYENIALGPNDYYVIKENKLFYLIDKTGKKIINQGYNMIFAFEDLLVVNDKDNLRFIDYEGNAIINTKIPTSIDYKEIPVNGVFGYNATKTGNNIIIEVNETSSTGYDTKKYTYNIDTQKLEVE